MKHEQTIVRVPKKLIGQVNHYLSLPLGLDHSAYQGEDNTIIVATIKCSNGYEIDIKCCGCQEEASWTEAVLFNENGAELCCTECCDEILGEWILEYDDIIYSVIIEEG
jgi:hypothetical protein